MKEFELYELLVPSEKTSIAQTPQCLNHLKLVEAEFIAKILFNLKLKSPRLDRDYLKKLQSGEANWTKIDGTSVSLSEEFDFDLLEDLGIVYFDHNWVHVSSYLPNNEAINQLHETVKPVIRFAKNIESIKYGFEDLNSIKYEIEKKKLDGILPENYKFTYTKINLDLDKDHESYLVSFSNYDQDSTVLISTYYWKLFLSKIHDHNSKSNYFDLREKFVDLIPLSSLDSISDDEQENLIGFFTEIIESSEVFKMSFLNYQNVLKSKKYLYHNLVTSKISVQIAIDGSQGDRSTEKETTRALDINEVKNIYSDRVDEPIETDIQLMYWGRNHDWFLGFNDLILNSLNQLINNDLYIPYTRVESRGFTNKIIERSEKNKVIRYYLVNCVFLRSSAKYYLYLLTNPSTFLTGFIKLLENIREKYHRNDATKNVLLLHCVELLCDSALDSILQNQNWNDLASLVFHLSSIVGRKNASKDSMEYICFEKILVKIRNKTFSITYKVLLEMIESKKVESHLDIHVLFLISEILRGVNFRTSLVSQSLVDKIRNNFLDKYSQVFSSSLYTQHSDLSASSYYADFYWEGLNEEKLIDSFLELCPSIFDINDGLKSKSNSCAISYMNALNNYIQVLINLHSLANANKPNIERKLRELSINFGFKKQLDYPLYKNLFLGMSESFDLWATFCFQMNSFSLDVFREILSGIIESAPLSAMMTLYKNTYIKERKTLIINEIDKINYKVVPEDSLHHIEVSFSQALEENKLDLAKISLNEAKHFLANHPYRKSGEFQSRVYRWQVLEYKYNILESYYSEETFENKEVQIEKITLPKIEVSLSRGVNYNKECVQFRRYVLALLIQENNPSKANAIFESLYKETKHELYLNLCFSSKLSCLLRNSANEEEYESLIVDYQDRFSQFDFNNLPLPYKNSYIYALYMAKKYDQAEFLCASLSVLEKYYKPLTITYSKILRIKNPIKASNLLNDYIEYHSIDPSDDGLSVEIKEIEEAICNDVEPVQDKIIRDQFLLEYKNVVESKAIFQQIKSKPANELLKIISSKENLTCDEILYDEISACLNEILKRAKNLEILNKSKDEDLVNDWVVSLFNQRLSKFSISISDQARTGKSESGKKVGETDGLIMDGENNYISLFEAMNLSSINNTIIDKHLNKISSYDQVGVSPVFIVSYCYFTDFPDSAEKYFRNLSKKQYTGFNLIDEDNHCIQEMKRDPKMYSAFEYRERGKKTIRIYHILIDLKI